MEPDQVGHAAAPGHGTIVAIPAALRPSFRNQPLTDISVARRLLRSLRLEGTVRNAIGRRPAWQPSGCAPNFVKVHCISGA
jgi:hypothetical protein